MSRKVADLLGDELGEQVNVLNATGGSGVTGHDRGARADPDGYTLTMITVEINMLHHRGLTELTYRDYRPVIMLNSVPAALIVHKDAEWTTLAELVEAVRASPGTLVASGTAKGGIWHLALAGWLKAAGLQADSVIWEPSQGAGPSLQELLTKGLQIVACSLPEAGSLLAAGEVRALGVMSAERLPHYPDVPTLKEQGFDWTLGGWRGLALPPETPDDVYLTILGAMERIVAGDAFREFMDQQGEAMLIRSSEAFVRELADVDEKMGVLLREQFADAAPDQFGPFFFPGVIGVGLALVLIGLALQKLRGVEAEAESSVSVTRKGFVHAIETLIAVAVFILVVTPVGFLIAGSVLVLYLSLRYGVRAVVAVPLSLLLVAGVYQLFSGILAVPLPRGLFGW